VSIPDVSAMIDLSRFRAVIFDFDGVIVDSETLQARAWTAVAREVGQLGREIAVHQIAGRIDRELAAELFPECDGAWCAARKAQIESEMQAAGELKPIDGCERLLDRLGRSHLLAICSSCRADVLDRRLVELGLRAFLRAVVGRGDGVPHKPAPDLYQRTLALLGVPAHDACAIEDSATGVAAAKAAGIFTIQLAHPDLPRAANADAWIGSFDELMVPAGEA
jgi:HAD superfamily hydrolase (TIGR01509 family)